MPITKRVQYRYDSVRNKIGMTDADGGLHTYTYDVMRRLTGVINPLGERTTYTYDLNGRRTSVQLANGTRTSYVYDVASRVQSVHTLKSDDSTVSKFEYEYDGNGRRTSVLEADGSRVTWTYDRISQVTSEWRTGTNPYRHTFTYDKVGNRTLKIEDGARTTLVYDAANQLVTSEDAGGTTTFTYDGNGNQTVVQKPSGDRTTQVWDYENRLIKTIQPSGGVTSMVYDVDGLRLKKEDATGTKLFVWDDQNYLAETDAAGATETAFTTEPSNYGGLISHRKAGASTTYHFDALGSTRALTNESEAVQERYNYTAFGTLLGSPTLLTPFLWGGMVGYYWDADLATQYIRARHYQPTIARWISLDPIGFAGGDANLFRYVGNSPTSGGMDWRVRLTTSAYGRWQLGVARSVLDYLIFARVYEGGKGRFLDASGNKALDQGTCEDAIEYLINNDKTISSMIAAMKGYGCTVKTPICMKCAKDGRAGAHFNPDDKSIIMCLEFPEEIDVNEPGQVLPLMQMNLLHELIHANDYCLYEFPTPRQASCNQFLCVEARAVSCGQQCAYSDPSTRRECIKDKMKYYVNKFPSCPKGEETVDDVLENLLHAKGCTCDKYCNGNPKSIPDPPSEFEW